MQISRTTFAPLNIEHQDPDMVHTRLEGIVDQLDDLGTRIQRDSAAGADVSADWPANVRAASTQLRFAAGSMRDLGGDREALLSSMLGADADQLSTFASDLATAATSHDHFGANHSDWVTRFTQPANDAQCALVLLEQAPAQP